MCKHCLYSGPWIILGNILNRKGEAHPNTPRPGPCSCAAESAENRLRGQTLQSGLGLISRTIIEFTAVKYTRHQSRYFFQIILFTPHNKSSIIDILQKVRLRHKNGKRLVPSCTANKQCQASNSGCSINFLKLFFLHHSLQEVKTVQPWLMFQWSETTHVFFEKV